MSKAPAISRFDLIHRRRSPVFWPSASKQFSSNSVLDHQLVQLAGADAGIVCRLIYFPFVAKEQFLEIPGFKIFDDLPPGSGQWKVVFAQ